MTTVQWLPDGLHPSREGSELFGGAVTDFLKSELQKFTPYVSDSQSPDVQNLPEPIYAAHWQSATLLPLESVTTVGPWLLRRVHTPYHVNQVWETRADGAALWCEFDGRGLVLICDFGHDSADFVYRIDGAEWQFAERERPDWCGERGLVRAFLVDDELPFGRHRFELKVVPADHRNSVKTEFRLAHIGVVA
jgi:hypothetical protein